MCYSLLVYIEHRKASMTGASFVLIISSKNNRIETSVQHSSCSKVLQKKRSRLTVSDEAILAEHPDKEDFLLPDINIAETPQWDNSTNFSQITIPTQTN